jgi:ABC-type bacteriocin/lantibiotic exporter with double-glycine peptidase domain
MPLSNPFHIPQIGLGYCLPACAQMALVQLGITLTQEAIAQILGTHRGIGTPFSRILRLRELGVDVQLSEWGGIDRMGQSLAANTAIIAAIMTSTGLPGWQNIRTQHTVLIVETSSDYVVYHDPALTEGPTSASRDEFLLAWSEMAEQVAFLASP